MELKEKEYQKYCAFCGSKINLEDKKCTYCGNSQEESNLNKLRVKCIKCESEDVNCQIIKNQKKNAFGEELYICTKCGTQFKDNDRLGNSFTNHPKIILSKKSAKFTKWILVLSIIVIILTFNHINGLKNSNGVYYPYSIENGVETTKSVFQIGEQLYCENKSFVVNSVSYPQSANGSVPSNGNKFISLNVTIQNIADESKLHDANDLELLLSNNNKIRKRFYSDIPSKQMASGESVTGNVIFEIPSNENKIVLNYYCDYWIDELIAKVNLVN